MTADEVRAWSEQLITDIEATCPDMDAERARELAERHISCRLMLEADLKATWLAVFADTVADTDSATAPQKN